MTNKTEHVKYDEYLEFINDLKTAHNDTGMSGFEDAIYFISRQQAEILELKKASEYIVFEKDKQRLKQISVPFDTFDEAVSFVETMQIGKYYKSIRPDLELVILKELESKS